MKKEKNIINDKPLNNKEEIKNEKSNTDLNQDIKNNIISNKKMKIKEKEIEKNKEKIETDIDIKNEKETLTIETKDTLPIKENGREKIKNDTETKKENDNYLKKARIKKNKQINSKKEKEKKNIIPKDKEKEEEKPSIKEVKVEDNNLLNLNQDKTISKNKKSNKENKEKTAKNNDVVEQENITKKDDDISTLIQKSKRLSFKKIEKKKNEPVQEKENGGSTINLNNNKDIKKDSSIDKKAIYKTEIYNNDNESIPSRAIKNNKKIDKSNDKNNINNKDINENIENPPNKKRKKKKINDNDIFKEKEKEINNKNELISLKKRPNIDTQNTLQNKLNNINNQKQKEKPKKYETTTQYKEKQENPDNYFQLKLPSKKHLPHKNKNLRYQLKSPNNRSRNEKSIILTKENQEEIESLEKKNNLFQSHKIVLNNNKLIERKTELINQNQPTQELKTQNNLNLDYFDNNSNSLTITHVNDINYFGETNNYRYLKNRVLRINNKKIPKNTARREEYKDNNDYNYNEEQLTDNNVYFKTGIENNKRKVVLKKEKQYTDDTDEVARKKRLERQKRKLKEELWGIGGSKSFRSKINNNNPINRKGKDINNDNYPDEFFDEDGTKRQAIKIVRKNPNNRNKEKNRNPNLLNKKEKYEKNLNDQCMNFNDLDDINNNEFPQDFKSTISVNTKIKDDPLNFITRYYLAKDKLKKITNYEEQIEEEQYNKTANVNFFEILKLLNETKKNNPEKKLKKFKGKQSPFRKIPHQNHKFNLSHRINYNKFINNKNNNHSPNETSLNPYIHINQSMPKYYRNDAYTNTEGNNLRYYYNQVSIKKVSQNKKRKKNKSVDNTEKRLNSCKRMCKVCNKAHRENIEIEKYNAFSAINIRNYDSEKSVSAKKKKRK